MVLFFTHRKRFHDFNGPEFVRETTWPHVFLVQFDGVLFRLRGDKWRSSSHLHNRNGLVYRMEIF
jgi:hypothetical protein